MNHRLALGLGLLAAATACQPTALDARQAPALRAATNTAPVADAGATLTVNLGDTVTLDGTASSDADGDTLAYRWKFSSTASGSSLGSDDIADRDADTTSFFPDVAGVYVATLKVSDGLAEDRANLTVKVLSGGNTMPAADAGSDKSVPVGHRSRLDASASVDADGDMLDYRWKLVSGPGASALTSANIEDRDGRRTYMTPDVAGDYLFRVKVSDAETYDTAFVTLTASESDTGLVSDTAWLDTGAGGVAMGCGDGAIDTTEECDDGNNDDGDGCSATCNVEDNYSCGPAGFTSLVGDDTWTSNLQSPDWVLSNNDQTLQETLNAQPSIYVTDLDVDGSYAVTFTLAVNTNADDDFIGFSVGFDAGDASASDADWLLFDWKQATQTSQRHGLATEGLAVSRVIGASTASELWTHSGAVSEVARASTLGSAGWGDQTSYEITLEASATRLQVWVDGTLEIDESGSFPTGPLGFYANSQADLEFNLLSPVGSVCEEVVDTADTGISGNDTGDTATSDTGSTAAGCWYTLDDGAVTTVGTDASYPINAYDDLDLFYYEPSGATGLQASSDPSADFAVLRDYVLDNSTDYSLWGSEESFSTSSVLSYKTEAEFTYYLCEWDADTSVSTWELAADDMDDAVLVLLNGEVVASAGLRDALSTTLDVVGGDVNTLVVVHVDAARVHRYLTNLGLYADGVLFSGQ